MLCPSLGQGPPLDHFTRIPDLGCASEKYVRWGQIPQRLMIALPIVVFDKPSNRLLQLPGEIVMLQTNHVFNRAVLALNFALSLRMIGRTMNMLDMIRG